MWSVIENFRQKSREKKYQLFIDQLNPNPHDFILNVGAGNGLFLEDLYEQKDRIIALDIEIIALQELKANYPDVICLIADATALPFKDRAMKIVFSNAVIEHVGSIKMQQKYADEINRVGGKYFVTTPNKYFPFEFHYALPCYQFIPKSIQKWLFKTFKIGLWYAKNTWEEINLLSYRQLKRLFPGSKITKQRITFYPETLICYKAN
jgi:ubiquinone/menaquinone biosynthesis C-methylase UbiE